MANANEKFQMQNAKMLTINRVGDGLVTINVMIEKDETKAPTGTSPRGAPRSAASPWSVPPPRGAPGVCIKIRYVELLDY